MAKTFNLHVGLQSEQGLVKLAPLSWTGPQSKQLKRWFWNPSKECSQTLVTSAGCGNWKRHERMVCGLASSQHERENLLYSSIKFLRLFLPKHRFQILILSQKPWNEGELMIFQSLATTVSTEVCISKITNRRILNILISKKTENNLRVKY